MRKVLSYLLLRVAALPCLVLCFFLWGPLQLPDLFPLALIGLERHKTPPWVEPDPASEKLKECSARPVNVCVSVCVPADFHLPLGPEFASDEAVCIYQLRPDRLGSAFADRTMCCVKVVKWGGSNCRRVLSSILCKYYPHWDLICWQRESGMLQINSFTTEFGKCA